MSRGGDSDGVYMESCSKLDASISDTGDGLRKSSVSLPEVECSQTIFEVSLSYSCGATVGTQEIDGGNGEGLCKSEISDCGLPLVGVQVGMKA